MYMDMSIIVRFLGMTKVWGTLTCLFFLSMAGETETLKIQSFEEVESTVELQIDHQGFQ